MVWLHGGGFFAGSAIEQLAYEGDAMAINGDVVVVTVNHRLNILGYLDLEPFGDKYKNSANCGNADLVAALKWVHENIAAFGGDPDNVTLFGQSGGGMKVTSLMQTPAADGLFHKAFVMSGVLDFDGFGELIDTATQTIDEIRTALNDGILDDLKATFASVRAITERLANGEGTLGKLLSSDDQLYTDLSAAVADIRAISDRLEKGEGTLGRLLSSDDQLYADAASAVSNINAISERLANGEGTLGKLLSPDDTLYADLSSAVASLRTVGENLANGEGTIGKLLADDEIYTEAQSLLREGRAAVDDLRETSPITTFSSIFFGIF